ncbi:hypothetical protein CDD82_3472 [Ophiocordyceps australis]|uniref:Uncharacterized protein n=1 Tax=Ophiocordyceps australis TaxID=1399860 RepID=A0A2C5Z916_9HYPO|nr:hypothetical protein CDD82_3472 [Ophiocordyceps australis]
MSDAELPIAMRRQRRDTSSHPAVALSSREPTTPRRDTKTVRFSSPGPRAVKRETQSSSGLTPMMRRASIATPRHRRASTPAATSPSRCYRSYQALFLKPSTVEGRVERRIRRGNMRDLLNKVEQQKKRSVQQAQAEARRLRSEIDARDGEISRLRNTATLVNIQAVEQQLDGELLDGELGRRRGSSSSSGCDWTLAARDPLCQYSCMDELPDRDDALDDAFGDATAAQFAVSTPSRARISFPTPPATSPAGPTWPYKAGLASHVGVQTSFPHVTKQQLEEELASLQLEVCKLMTTLDSYRTLGQRIRARLSMSCVEAQSDETSEASCLHDIEQQVDSLMQAMDDRAAALELLTSSIAQLGFPGNGAAEMVVSLTSGFRAARLELEYLTPGEMTLPLTSHGAEVLDLLLTRLRAMATKCQQDEACIDEYHEIEQSLRKQLDARVSVVEELKADIVKAEKLVGEQARQLDEAHISNDRLRGAIDCYVRDIAELEKLVERLEQQARDAHATHRALHKSDLDTLAAREATIAELETKLAHTVQETERLQAKLGHVHESKTSQVLALNKRHGEALALRDARVLELRDQVDRVNESLQRAHDSIEQLRADKEALSTRMADEKRKAKAAVDGIKTELQRAVQMGQAFLDSPKGKSPSQQAAKSRPVSVPGPVKRPRRLWDAEMDKRSSSSSKRRRGDSGMALVEEDEVDA